MMKNILNKEIPDSENYYNAIFIMIEDLMDKTDKKVIDFCSYKIEKSLKKNGFTIKKDKEKNIKVLLKIKK